MIDLAYNRCECGNPECDYDPSLPICEEQQVIADALVLESPILKLVKERNEARELVKRMLSVADRGTGEEEYFKAMLAAFTAVQAWRGGAK